MLPRYDRTLSYEQNFEAAPPWDVDFPELTKQPMPWPTVSNEDWQCVGRPITAPIAVAAGPLLNGRWLNYYSQLGFDYLTYKTVRTRSRTCYPAPNLQPVAVDTLTAPGELLPTQSEMRESWAISFGMPSKLPNFWQEDVARTKRALRPGTTLSVSVVASPDRDDGRAELIDDYAECAALAAEAGADVVELNLSCPNVESLDGQIFLNPPLAEDVVRRVRERAPDRPILIKVGFIESESLMASLIDHVAPFIDGMVTVNCISARISSGTDLLFDGSPRGIGGAAIHRASVAQVEMARKQADRSDSTLEIIGCGGVFTASDVQRFLSAGASNVQLATAVMLDPAIGLKLRLEANHISQA